MTERLTPAPAGVTDLLLQWSAGDARALSRLMPLVYAELRRIARAQLRREAHAHAHAIEPTALVHEVYLRFIDQDRAGWQNRAQFYAVAAQLMRRVIVDQARARQAGKRGGSAVHVVLQDVDELAAPPDGRGGAAHAADVLAIDQALDRLAALDPDQARITELRFFAGMTVAETAHVLKRSPRTIKREWRLAKAWLHRELGSAR